MRTRVLRVLRFIMTQRKPGSVFTRTANCTGWGKDWVEVRIYDLGMGGFTVKQTQRKQNEERVSFVSHKRLEAQSQCEIFT